jgi:hypothetical protein
VSRYNFNFSVGDGVSNLETRTAVSNLETRF